MLQAYSALPFNITSGVTTIQGTAGRPDRRRRSSSRATPASGDDFFTLERAGEPRVPRCAGRVRIEGLVEAFNLTNRRNDLTRNTQLRRRRLSDEPVADVQPDHRRGRSAVVPVRVAGSPLGPGDACRI